MMGSPALSLNTAFSHHRSGRLDEAEALYRSALAHEPDNLNALQLLGMLLHARGRSADALDLLEQAVAVARRRGDRSKNYAVLHNNLGMALRGAGRWAEAADHYRCGIELDPDLPELHENLANVLLDTGDIAGAIVRYEQARRLGRISPNGLYLLGRAQRDCGDNRAAIDMLRRCVELDPHAIAPLHDLGVLLAATGLKALAVPFLERAAGLDSAHVSSHVELGNVLHSLGDKERAFACFQRAGELRPLTTWLAKQRPAQFSALVVTAPGSGNIPPHFLFGQAAFDCHFFALLPGIAPDIDRLRTHGDIVVNLICDLDQGREILSVAADLCERLDKPTINHPRKVLATGRDDIANLLSGLPGCKVPPTLRATRAMLAAPDALDRLRQRGIALPLLLRIAGTHGGDAFEKVSGTSDIAAFLVRHSGDDFYATAYVDYQAHDGYFRKYRFIFTNGDILPYHLAIADQWKVHHFRSDMSRHPWMKDEEKLFLEDPGRAFSSAHYGVLRQIQRAVDLEFFGIDCSLDRAGNLVVFEVNASMLIHDDNAEFPYKTPACMRIKHAFAATLRERVRGQRPDS